MRRRSPSVKTPSTRRRSSTIAVIPSPLRLISSRPSRKGVSGATHGSCSPVRITSSTCSNRRRPEVPPGCERAKSSSVKPRASSTATASASPIASVAVVLAVGARLCGQASSGTLTSSTDARRFAERRLRPAGHRDQRHAQALDDGQDRDQLGGFAGVRDARATRRRR